LSLRKATSSSKATLLGISRVGSSHRALAAITTATVLAAAYQRKSASCSTAAGKTASFVVTTKLIAGAYDAVVISTDLEPDDIVAIRALSCKLQGVPLLVVVGEGDQDGKLSMAADILASCGLRGSIVEGVRSSANFPLAALDAFSSSSSAVQKHSKLLDGLAQDGVAAFLAAYKAPLALLLKPPIEFAEVPPSLLAKTSAIAYGSFNFVRFREELGKRSSSPLLETLINAFGAFVLVERSHSVGREAVLSPEQSGLWPLLERDEGLMKLTYIWNAATVRKAAKHLQLLGKQLVAASDANTSWDFMFNEVANSYNKSTHTLAILGEIARLKGREICLADPLIAAILLDDDGALAKFVRPCSLRFGKSGRIHTDTSEAAAQSKVGLLTAGEEEREELLKLVCEILAKGLAAA